jgi:hypothetical protein
MPIAANPDAQSQRQHSNGRDAGMPGKTSNPVANVFEESVHSYRHPK